MLIRCRAARISHEELRSNDAQLGRRGVDLSNEPTLVCRPSDTSRTALVNDPDDPRGEGVYLVGSYGIEPKLSLRLRLDPVD